MVKIEESSVDISTFKVWFLRDSFLDVIPSLFMVVFVAKRQKFALISRS